MPRTTPISPTLRHAFCALLLAMCISLGTQAKQLQQLLSDVPPYQSAAEMPSMQRLGTNAASLFGSKPEHRQALKTEPRLRLLASFVQTDSRHSIALIAIDNGRPRRLREGEEIAKGLHVEKIDERGIVISRNGQASTIGLQGWPTLAEAGR